MAVKIIYFVHGTTQDNVDHKSTGWLPGILTKKGIEQSIELKKQINIDEIDVVFCSDLQRAVDSANYTFEGLKTVITDARLRECNYGEYNGQDSKLVNYAAHITKKFPGGESLKDVEKRMKEFCIELKQNYDGKTVAIIAHKAPQFAFQVLTQNMTWEQAIKEDWRKIKAWKPGWEYIVK